MTTKKKTRKAPGTLDPAVVLSPPGGVKYVTVTQDKSPWLCSERHDEYFFGRAKTAGLGQLTTKNKTTEKRVLLDPGVKNKKSPGGIGLLRFPPPLWVQNTLRSLKICAQVV